MRLKTLIYIFQVFQLKNSRKAQKIVFFISCEKLLKSLPLSFFPSFNSDKKENTTHCIASRRRRLFSFKLKENLLFGLSHLVYTHTAIHPVSPKIVFQPFLLLFWSAELKLLTLNKILFFEIPKKKNLVL